MWAGGPLGFSAGHPTVPSGFHYDSPAWAGQLDLAGFPLTDVARLAPRGTATTTPSPPLLGTNQSSLGGALDLQYPGTADGANVSEVVAHAGVVLGTIAASPGPAGVSPRTSICFLPVGEGGIYYFGGADLSSYQSYVPFANGWITGGTLDVASDMAELIGLGFTPVSGPSTSQDVQLGPGESIVKSLSLANYTGGVAVLVRCGVDWTTFALWGESIGSPPLPFVGAVPRVADEAPIGDA
ncbi:MAG: hypothetical protein L3K17_00680 [Thermoplasmata archaeon]|nr:hypothetical protein [Thermoplasmata archaeon]